MILLRTLAENMMETLLPQHGGVFVMKSWLVSDVIRMTL